MSMFVVVDDPKLEYWEGAVVNQDYAAVLKSRGVALLPVEPELFLRGAISGYFRRAWGAGWPLDHPTPRMNCPMALFAYTDRRSIHWCARLLPAREADLPRIEQGFLQGNLRFAGDSGQPFGSAGGLHTTGGCYVEGTRLGKADAQGGWTVGGSAVLTVVTEGVFTCALYGAAPGLRVAWAAVSQTA